MEICANFLFSDKHPSPSFTRVKFVEMMNLVTSSVEFILKQRNVSPNKWRCNGLTVRSNVSKYFVGFHELRLFLNDLLL